VKRWPKRTMQHSALVVVVSMQLIALVFIVSIILMVASKP
jgi:steroid 5-alpha reductase family enzyme